MISKLKNLNNIYKIIIIVAIIITILITNSIINNPQRQLKKYFKDNYYKNEYGSSTYYKPVSLLNLDDYNGNIKYNFKAEYEMNYFNIETHEFSKNKREYNYNIESNLNETYSYKTNIITYNYRVVVENIATTIYKGTYDTNTEKLTCKKEYAYNIDAEDNDEVICDNIKDELLNFQYEAFTIIEDRIIKLLQK